MLSQNAIQYLKNNNYSFEEIEGINLGLEQSKEGKCFSREEMQEFVKTELFSKYTINV